VELDDTDRAAEETVSARDRVLAALRTVEEAGPAELTELCQSLKITTIRKTLSELRNEEPPLIENTENFEGRAHKVRLTVTAPYRSTVRVRQDDTPDTSTVAGLVANPPDWLPGQLDVYRQPKRPPVPTRCLLLPADRLTRPGSAPAPL